MGNRWNVFKQEAPMRSPRGDGYEANFIHVGIVTANTAKEAIDKARSPINRWPAVQERKE